MPVPSIVQVSEDDNDCQAKSEHLQLRQSRSRRVSTVVSVSYIGWYDHDIVHSKPPLDEDSRVEAAQHGKAVQYQEDNVDNEKCRPTGDRVDIVGFWPGCYDGFWWYAHRWRLVRSLALVVL